MTIELTEKEIKDIDKFTGVNLKNKLQMAIERGQDDVVDAYLKYIKENNLDTLNNLNQKESYLFHTTWHSLLNKYQKDFKEASKNYIYGREYNVDFTLLHKLMDAGLDVNKTFINSQDEEINIVNILFSFDNKNTDIRFFNKIYEEILSHFSMQKTELKCYLTLLNKNSFKDTKNKNKTIEYFNKDLLNILINKHFQNNIELVTTSNDIEHVTPSRYSGLYKLTAKNSFDLISDYTKKNELSNEDLKNVMKMFLFHSEIKIETIVDFFDKNNIDFNKEMNVKSKHKYSNEILPLLVKLVKEDTQSTYWGVSDKFKKLIEHYDFKFKDFNFMEVFKASIYMNGNFYNTSTSDCLSLFLEKGADFNGEDKNGKGVFHQALYEANSSKFFMQILEEKNFWDLDYKSKSGKNLLEIFSEVIDQRIKSDTRYSIMDRNNFLVEKIKNDSSYISDDFVNSIAKRKDSQGASVVLDILKDKIAPDYEDDDGNNLTLVMVQMDSYAYKQNSLYQKEISITNDNVNNFGENYMHLLIQNPSYSNTDKIKSLISSIKNGFDVEKTDNKGLNPIQYFKNILNEKFSMEEVFVLVDAIKNVEIFNLPLLNHKNFSVKELLIRIAEGKMDKEYIEVEIDKRILRNVLDVKLSEPKMKKRI